MFCLLWFALMRSLSKFLLHTVSWFEATLESVDQCLLFPLSTLISVVLKGDEFLDFGSVEIGVWFIDSQTYLLVSPLLFETILVVWASFDHSSDLSILLSKRLKSIPVEFVKAEPSSVLLLPNNHNWCQY